MKFGNYGVFDLLVFDENEKMVAKLDSLKNSKIFGNNNEIYVYVKDALLNLDILKFLHVESDNTSSDYQNYLNSPFFNGNVKTIVFNFKNIKKCKLIARGTLRREENKKDETYLFDIPLAEIINEFIFDGHMEEISAFDLIFKVNPYNENGDSFKMHLFK